MAVATVIFSVVEDVYMVLESLVVLLAVGVAWFSLRMMTELQVRGEKAMSSFQLHQDEAVKEFEYLFGGSVLLVVGAAFYLAGGLVSSDWLVNIGLVFETGYIASIGFVLYRWWGRF